MLMSSDLKCHESHCLKCVGICIIGIKCCIIHTVLFCMAIYDLEIKLEFSLFQYRFIYFFQNCFVSINMELLQICFLHFKVNLKINFQFRKNIKQILNYFEINYKITKNRIFHKLCYNYDFIHGIHSAASLTEST